MTINKASFVTSAELLDTTANTACADCALLVLQSGHQRTLLCTCISADALDQHK
jgi:hypothetical protein